MNKYGHLNEEEREVIRIGLEIGKKYRAIGREIGRHHTTISREVKRNGMKQGKNKGKYIACKAQAKANKRARDQRYKAPLKCPEIFLYVRKHLREDKWSPERIAGRLSMDRPGLSIHHETIYRYIYSKPVKNRYKLWKYLKLGRKKRRVKTGRPVRNRHSRIVGAIPIDKRPIEANERKQAGHWETDLMEGLKSEQVAISVTVDRKTRYSILDLVPNHTGMAKHYSLHTGFTCLPSKLIKTITSDNGVENSAHLMTADKLKALTYFCHAYRSWEKGSVENSIGYVRRYLPKKTSLLDVTREQIFWIQDQLNNRPMKCLNWRTPHEMFQREIRKLESK